MERREIRENVFQTEYDVLIVGAGVAGMNCAMHLPTGFRVLMISKGGLRESDSYLAQGGICVLRDPRTSTAISKIPCGRGITKTTPRPCAV